MNTIRLGQDKVCGEVGIDFDRLLRTRLAVFSNSGGGKSHLLRLIAEQAVKFSQVIILDPEGEFYTLADTFPFAVLQAGEELNHRQVGNVVEQLIQTNASVILDVSNWPIGIKRAWTGAFLARLVQSIQPGSPQANVPRLVIADEVHLFCPQGEGSAATKPMASVMAMGRKRGICGIMASQRVSKVHKDTTAEVSNIIVGRTTLDTDQKRAGDMIGLDGYARKQLRDMQVGQFFAYGPAMTGSKNTGVQRFISDMVKSPHEAGQKVVMPDDGRQAAADKLLANIRTMKVNYEDVEYGKKGGDDELPLSTQPIVVRKPIWECVPFDRNISEWEGEKAQDMIRVHNNLVAMSAATGLRMNDVHTWEKYAHARSDIEWWRHEEHRWYDKLFWGIINGTAKYPEKI